MTIRSIFALFRTSRRLIFGVFFACIFITRTQLTQVRKLLEVPQMDGVEKLTKQIQNASGAFDIECASYDPKDSIKYNYSLLLNEPSSISSRQWCCLTPDMKDITKVRSAPSKKGGSKESSSSNIQTPPLGSYSGGDGKTTSTATDPSSVVITGADGSQWRVPNKSRWTWKCLPSFIIAGTQKSGSTALSAYLLAHPQVSMGRSKEVHFFDKPIVLGLLPYLINFASINGAGGMGVVDPLALSEFAEVSREEAQPKNPVFVNGEATPFYIADRTACQNMKEQLPEAPALVVLVRDPVERAYSEYMMKKRRVESQDKFLDILDRNAYALLQCLAQSLNANPVHVNTSAKPNTPTRQSNVERCSPTELTTHSKWKDLKKGLRELTSKKTSVDSNQLDNVLPCFFTRTPWTTQSMRRVTNQSLPQGAFSRGPLNETQPKHSSRYYVTRSALGDVAFIAAANRAAASSPFVHFDVDRCVPKGLSERFPSTDIFRREMANFTKCAGESAHHNIESLDAAVSKCVKVHHGISDQFIYRSMYAAQLHHCFKSIPKEKVLVIDSSQLKKTPQQVLNLIHRHLGIADYQYPDILNNNQNQAENLQKIFDKYYPSFEERTGWRMDGEYEPMPTQLKETIQNFFKPHNSLLEEMTGQSFNWH